MLSLSLPLSPTGGATLRSGWNRWLASRKRNFIFISLYHFLLSLHQPPSGSTLDTQKRQRKEATARLQGLSPFLNNGSPTMLVPRVSEIIYDLKPEAPQQNKRGKRWSSSRPIQVHPPVWDATMRSEIAFQSRAKTPPPLFDCETLSWASLPRWWFLLLYSGTQPLSIPRPVQHSLHFVLLLSSVCWKFVDIQIASHIHTALCHWPDSASL